MINPVREDVILAPSSILQSGEIDRLNQILQGVGLGRPLHLPEPTDQEMDAECPDGGSGELVVLGVAGAGALTVREALREAAKKRREQVPELTPYVRYVADTVEKYAQETKLYNAYGKESGHAAIAWQAAPSYVRLEAPDPTVPVENRPVIGLLDTCVRDHPWLPRPSEFYVEADGWSPGMPIRRPPQHRAHSSSDDRAKRNFGSHYGHGTFNAGLIRLAGPDVRVMPVRVMSDDGEANERILIKALTWLADRRAQGVRLDVVCLPFGRYRDDELKHDDDLEDLKDAIKKLTMQKVMVVASAGNDGLEEPTWPAAFATDPELSVVSVGGRVSRTQRAPFSNYGVWVTQWLECTHAISCMPLWIDDSTDKPCYAFWSGTSFGAATYAGMIAQERVGIKETTNAHTRP